MREQLARWVACVLGVVTVALALGFAWIHNREPTAAPQPAATLRPMENAARGRAGEAIYVAQRCAACHSIAGAGNPRFPLDGVAARLDDAALRDWIIGAPAVAERLPDGVLRRKQNYRALGDGELDALVAYLRALPGVAPR